jgi:hypothetical protein
VQVNHFGKLHPDVNTIARGFGYSTVTTLIWKLLDVKDQKRWAAGAKEVRGMKRLVGEFSFIVLEFNCFIV